MNIKSFFCTLLRHTGYALAVLAGVGFFVEKFVPAAVAPFVPLPLTALASVLLLLLSSLGKEEAVRLDQ